jgi:hypothetical protein
MNSVASFLLNADRYSLVDKPQADKPQADKPQADKPQAVQPQAGKIHPDGESQFLFRVKLLRPEFIKSVK